MITFIVTLLVSALIICLAAWLLPGISVKNYGWAIVVALVVGLLNALFGMVIPQFGFLVSLVVDALAIWLAGKMLKAFKVSSFWWALGCALVIACCQYALGMAL